MALTRITKGVIKPNENYDTHNINSTGIVTAIGLDINGNGDISGNLSVGGVLTYEDVTSIDSVGIITAQKDIHVGAGISVVGVGSFGTVKVGTGITFESNGQATFSGITTSRGYEVNGYSDGAATYNYVKVGRLKIYDNGTNNHLFNGYAAPLYLQGSALRLLGNDILLYNTASSRYYFRGENLGAASLYWAGSNNHGVKLATSEKGITVGTGVTIETNGQATFVGIITAADGINCTTDGVGNGINIGASQDLIIQHNGTNSFIDNNTGDLYIQTTGSGDDILIESADDFTVKTATKTAIEAVGDGAVKIYHNGSTNPKIYTNSIGVTIDNVLYISGPAGNPGRLRFQEGGALCEIRGVRNTDNSSFLYFDTEISGTTDTRLIIDGSGHLRPYVDSTYDLGITGTRWRNVYADTYYGDGSNLTGISADKIFENNSKVEVVDTGTGYITAEVDGTERLQVNSNGVDVTGTITMDAVTGTNTNAALNVLFQTASGVIDGGSQLTYNPSQDLLSVNGLGLTVNQILGGGNTLVLAAANFSSTTQISVTNKVNILVNDNNTDAFTLKQGSNEYITVDTNNSSELITLGNRTTGPDVLIEAGTTTFKHTHTNTYAANDTTQCGYQSQNLSDNTNTYSALRLTAGSSTPATAQLSSIRTGAGQNDFTIQLETGNTAFEAFRALSNGNFGFGIAAPTTQSGKVAHFHAGNAQQRIHLTNSTTGTTSTDGFEILIDQESNTNCRIRNFEAGYMAFDTGGANHEVMRLKPNGSVNIGGDFDQTTYKLKVTGSFAATTKSFVIDHPTKEKHKLRYACLEGPENSVYVRGKTSDSVIELPDYWTGLVHEDSITVNVTPIGNHKVWVESINNNSVTIGSDGSEYFYTVFAERKDVDKLEVEVEE